MTTRSHSSTPERRGAKARRASAPKDRRQPSRISVTRAIRAPDLSDSLIRRAIVATADGRVIASISVALVSDAEMSTLHGRYMNDASPTDVLTFDLRDEASATELDGEIVVSVDTAKRQAKLLRLPPTEELLRYIIHGMLHLCGLDDRTAPERRGMRAAEDRVLGTLRSECATRRGRTVRSASHAQ